MELNFSSAVEVKTNENIPAFLAPGNHIVTIMEVKKGESAQKKTPFVEISVQDKNLAKCSHVYYISEGSMPYTTRAILTLIEAAFDCTEEIALTKVTGLSTENIDMKLSSLLVGKEIAINIAGEEIMPTGEDKSKWIKSVFGGFTFARPVKDLGKLSTKVHIKAAASIEAASGITVGKAGDDLPW